MRTTCRPKHQVLVLKCYPVITKNMADPKPNPSELSYLLYYASSRRSKLQKVGVFLEKRTQRDLWRVKFANVQITLDICEALIEKCPKDLNLFAPSILSVISSVLRAGDVSLTDYSLAAFAAFCKHHDGANLASDQAYVDAFESILTLYAQCAGQSTPGSKPFELRWRSIGLQAVKCIAGSEALSGANSERQVGIIAPVIVRNLLGESEEKLNILKTRLKELETEQAAGGGEKAELTLSRVLTSATIVEGATVAAEVSDKLEEEDIGVLALQSLKKMFETNNQTQIWLSTDAVIGYICSLDSVSEKWATALMEMVARWAPVQYRYQILTRCQRNMLERFSAATDPAEEGMLEKQVMLAGIISHLLSSSVNLIGLSVMDVLINFTAQISQLLRHETVHSSSEDSPAGSRRVSPRSSAGSVGDGETSGLRSKLLEKLEKCIGDLATHIYYSDQITDMVSELLLHLKPSAPPSPTPNASGDRNSPAQTTASLGTDLKTPTFFSSALARRVGLRALKNVLVIADKHGETSGVGRHKVPLRVWEGTHWILRDEDAGVRRAYVDAFVTFLRLEIGDHPDAPTTTTSAAKKDTTSPSAGPPSPPRRRLSAPTAWHHLPPSNLGHPSTFLKLLHIQIYEQTLLYPSDTAEIMTLHLLLTSLADYIGLNAALCGLPMMFRLLEEVRSLGDDKKTVYVGSLGLGYFERVGRRLGLDGVRKIVEEEIEKRKERAQWFYGIRNPPIAISKISNPTEEKHNYISAPTEAFEIRDLLVEELVNYLASPQFLHRQASTSNCSSGHHNTVIPTAQNIKDLLLGEWSPDSVLASLEATTSRQGSLAESKLLTGGTMRSYLNLSTANGNGNGRPNSTSPALASHPFTSPPQPQQSALERLRAHANAHSNTNSLTHSPPRSRSASSSSRNSTVRVAELKRVLASAELEVPLHSASSRGSSSAESSLLSLPEGMITDDDEVRGHSPSARPRTAPSRHNHHHGGGSGRRAPTTIPPVPPLPPTLDLPGSFPLSESTPPLSVGTGTGTGRRPVTSASTTTSPSSPPAPLGLNLGGLNLSPSFSTSHPSKQQKVASSARSFSGGFASHSTSPNLGYGSGERLDVGRFLDGIEPERLAGGERRRVSGGMGSRPGTAVGGSGGGGVFRPPY